MTRPCQQENDVGGCKADGENLHRGEAAVNEDLRAYEAGSPEYDGADGEYVPDGHGAGRCLQIHFHFRPLLL